MQWKGHRLLEELRAVKRSVKWGVAGGDSEKGAEGGAPGAVAVATGDELVEVRSEMLAAQAVIDAQATSGFGPISVFFRISIE
jgi:hypothetical protein